MANTDTADHPEPTSRRDFLFIATGAVGAVGYVIVKGGSEAPDPGRDTPLDVTYTQLVGEIADEPDYDAALAALG